MTPVHPFAESGTPAQPEVLLVDHDEVNLMLIALIFNSMLKTSGGGVTWKGRTYKPGPPAPASPEAEVGGVSGR